VGRPNGEGASVVSRRPALTPGGILYRLFYQLDLLLFFTKGHRMLAVAHRRAWRRRDTPVLVDGRTLSEAVLSKAGR
jgi:hypothetical protein